MPNNLGKRFTEMLDETATKAEVSKLFKMLTDFVKEAKTRLETMHSSHMQEMTYKAETLEKRVETAEKQLSQGVSDAKEAYKSLIYSESRTLLRMMEQKVADFAAKIPEEYEDDEIRAEIEAIRKSIPVVPPQFDASDILTNLTELFEKVEDLEKRVKELALRPIGRGGGGTSAIGVAHAFKYIGHTEEPIGDIDGVNTIYYVNNTIYWIAGFMLNGEQIAEIPNFTYAGNKITFATALPAAYSGKDFEVKYIGF